MGVRGTSFSQVVVEVALIPASHQAVQIPLELLKPAVNEVLRIKLLRLDLSDRSERDNNPTDDDSVARYAEMLEGPAIAQELGA